MRARRQLGWVALVGALVTAPALATEPASKPPSRPHRYRLYVDRGNAIPAPYALGALAFGANVHMGVPTQAELSLGYGVGVTQRIWLDGSVGTLRAAPSLLFHSGQIGPNVLLVDAPAFELDAMVHVSGPSDDGRIVEQIEPGLYTVARVEHALRVDTALYFDVNPGAAWTYGVRLPTALSFQLVEKLYATVSSGVTLNNLADPRESTAIPLGLSLGWSDYVSPGGPSVAISPSINFPQLMKPWANEAFRPGVVTVGITFYYVWKY